MLSVLYMLFCYFFLLAKEILCNTRGEFTLEEKRFLTLNPIEWTRNNYPYFCRMMKDSTLESKELPEVPYRIIETKRVRLNCE